MLLSLKALRSLKRHKEAFMAMDPDFAMDACTHAEKALTRGSELQQLDVVLRQLAEFREGQHVGHFFPRGHGRFLTGTKKTRSW